MSKLMTILVWRIDACCSLLTAAYYTPKKRANHPPDSGLLCDAAAADAVTCSAVAIRSVYAPHDPEHKRDDGTQNTERRSQKKFPKIELTRSRT